jgi:hypothetical protein
MVLLEEVKHAQEAGRLKGKRSQCRVSPSVAFVLSMNSVRKMVRDRRLKIPPCPRFDSVSHRNAPGNFPGNADIIELASQPNQPVSTEVDSVLATVFNDLRSCEAPPPLRCPIAFF